MDDGTLSTEKVFINGQEYDPTEAQNFIERGKQTIELEQKWNTPVDTLWPQIGKSNQAMKETQAELENARAELAKFQTKQNSGSETTTDIKQAREAAKALGIVLDDDLSNSGYVKKDDLDSYFDSKRQAEKEAEKILAEGDRLESEIDGKDGRPAFNKKAVLAYASSYGFDDLNTAYEDMHKPVIDAWKQAQIEAKKTAGLKTLDNGSLQKSPKDVKINEDNVKELLREALNGSNSEE